MRIEIVVTSSSSTAAAPDLTEAARPPQYHRAGESAARDALLPPGRGRRRAAPAEARAVPAGARDRDPRARAGRPEVDPHRRGPARADAGVGAPRPLCRAEGPQAGRGAAWQDRARPGGDAGTTRVAAAPRPRRERELEP